MSSQESPARQRGSLKNLRSAPGGKGPARYDASSATGLIPSRPPRLPVGLKANFGHRNRQFRTHAPQQRDLLDHLVGARKQGRRYL
jgi:hypothetical protein